MTVAKALHLLLVLDEIAHGVHNTNVDGCRVQARAHAVAGESIWNVFPAA